MWTETGGWTYWQMDMTKLIVAFRYFANEHKNSKLNCEVFLTSVLLPVSIKYVTKPTHFSGGWISVYFAETFTVQVLCLQNDNLKILLFAETKCFCCLPYTFLDIPFLKCFDIFAAICEITNLARITSSFQKRYFQRRSTTTHTADITL
jgi:hypothetical protein